MNKPNCYECKYRGEVPGDAHSCCNHPAVKQNPFKASAALSIKGDHTGIRNGWFLWPFNFDPVWLKSCSGFDTKAKPVETPEAV